ncbi:GtrA family protein [Anaerophilus nitritogenes]|uniref:GtrA family protein n=1 Tax=Anaerophilus nitritogenes TaxID=2498136 RepID=UPI00101E1D05|nr:GtrA family protein [Anaerophilus nitritogenes]
MDLKTKIKKFEKYNIKKITNYLVLGILTTGINIVVFTLCIKMNIYYLWSNGIAFILAILFAYTTNKKWVFHKQSKQNNTFMELSKFLGCRVFTLILESILLFILITQMFFNPYRVKIFTNIIVIILNYGLSECFVFNDRVYKGSSNKRL